LKFAGEGAPRNKDGLDAVVKPGLHPVVLSDPDPVTTKSGPTCSNVNKKPASAGWTATDRHKADRPIRVAVFKRDFIFKASK